MHTRGTRVGHCITLAKPGGGGMTNEHYPRVAFQGELGAFSEEAVYTLWSPDGVQLLPRPDCFAAARAVLTGDADYAVLPFENTLAGSVSEAYDALCEHASLQVIAETIIPIDQCILAAPGAVLENLTVAHSHRIALAQCRGFLGSNPRITASPAYDTAGAARDVATRGSRTECAIAGRVAARRYGLAILAERIQDSDDNQTRFWVITNQHRLNDRHPMLVARDRSDRQERALPAFAEQLDRRSEQRLIICAGPFSAADARIGETLSMLSQRNLRLSHLEARPTGTPWEHYYVIEALYDSAVNESGDVDSLMSVSWHRLAGVVEASATNSRSVAIAKTDAAQMAAPLDRSGEPRYNPPSNSGSQPYLSRCIS